MQSSSHQNGLTVLAAIDKQHSKTLIAALNRLEATIVNGSTGNPFIHIRNIHFARFVLLPEYSPPDETGTIPAQLVYSCCHDKSLNDHLQELLHPEVINWFHDIFSCCLGYDAKAGAAKALPCFIQANATSTNAFYRGYTSFSAALIELEQEMYDCIQHYLNKTDMAVFTPAQIKQQLLNQVKNNCPGYTLLNKHSVPSISAMQAVILFLVAFAGILAGVCFISHALFWALLILIIAFIAFSAVLLRKKEKKDQAAATTFYATPDIQQLTSQEDFITQNQLTHLVPLSPGRFRKGLLKTFLFVIDVLSRITFTRGQLAGISSIHFAGWSVIDHGKRLLFLSNFDGSWENYLSDFVDRAATGLTGIWSNSINFPETCFLVLKGASDEEKFKKWARHYQVKTQVWYSAHKASSVKNIWRNHQVARGLQTEMDVQETMQWLKLL